MRRTITTAIVSGAAMLALLIQPFLLPQDAGAVTAADWQAGNIIDDAIFTNTSAMTVSQIQSWLDTRLQNCDYYGTKPSELSGGIDYDKNGVVTRAEYGRTMGNPAPFTCLNDYYEVPKTAPSSTVPVNNYGTSTIPTGAKSAAQLIYDAAQAYNINPKVLLVKLGTESAGPLTSDPWPFERQYTYAMGAHCPDSGPGGSANCDTDYAGFSLQIREAAKLLRWYLDSMNESWWPYKKPYATNYILWNVEPTGCGGSNVYIKNKATAALYTYTPYQPNTAALNNLYGTGDGCSAYGNRNFWRVYNDWFGSTRELYSYSFERLVGNSPSVTVASAIEASGSVKTITLGKQIYTFYSDFNAQTLRYSYWNGSRWSDHLLDGPGSTNTGSTNASISVSEIEAFTYNNGVQLYYYDSTSKTLRHGFTKNGKFVLETLDGADSSIIKRVANTDVGSAISGFQYGAGRIQLYYYNATNKSLVHTWWDGERWRSETLDGTTTSIIKRGDDVGSAISGLSYGNGIQLFYRNNTRGELLHTWWNGKKWSTERMDGDTDTLFRNYIDSGKFIETNIFDNKLFVAYYDDATPFSTERTSAWRIAYWTGREWIQNTLDGGTGSKSLSTTAVPLGDITMAPYDNRSMQAFYKDSTGGIKHAWIRE